jgi:hypothetical protein
MPNTIFSSNKEVDAATSSEGVFAELHSFAENAVREDLRDWEKNTVSHQQGRSECTIHAITGVLRAKYGDQISISGRVPSQFWGMSRTESRQGSKLLYETVRLEELLGINFRPHFVPKEAFPRSPEDVIPGEAALRDAVRTSGPVAVSFRLGPNEPLQYDELSGAHYVTPEFYERLGKSRPTEPSTGHAVILRKFYEDFDGVMRDGNGNGDPLDDHTYLVQDSEWVFEGPRPGLYFLDAQYVTNATREMLTVNANIPKDLKIDVDEKLASIDPAFEDPDVRRFKGDVIARGLRDALRIGDAALASGNRRLLGEAMVQVWLSGEELGKVTSPKTFEGENGKMIQNMLVWAPELLERGERSESFLWHGQVRVVGTLLLSDAEKFTEQERANFGEMVDDPAHVREKLWTLLDERLQTTENRRVFVDGAVHYTGNGLSREDVRDLHGLFASLGGETETERLAPIKQELAMRFKEDVPLVFTADEERKLYERAREALADAAQTDADIAASSRRNLSFGNSVPDRTLVEEDLRHYGGAATMGLVRREESLLGTTRILGDPETEQIARKSLDSLGSVPEVRRLAEQELGPERAQHLFENEGTSFSSIPQPSVGEQKTSRSKDERSPL